MSSKSIRSGVPVDILVVGARGIPGVEGGAEKHAEMAFPVLAQRGYRITLLGMRRYIDRPRYKGVELRHVPSVSFAKSDKLIYNFFAAIHSLFLRPKIVHLQGLNAAIFLFIYRLFGLKTVLRYSSADRLHKKWGFLGRNALRLCEAQLRFAKTVIVVSENYQVDLRKRLKLQNVVVVPNGIDVVERASQDDSDCFWNSYCPEDARFVLTVGRLTVDKGFESLIEAVKAIEDRKLRLFIVGGVSEEEYAEKLRNLADDRVHFLGRLDRNEIHRLYEKCALYVNCSYFEGLSNALLEAISHDCPLVVSDIVANVEMPLREESYFPVGDVEALTECIKRALDKPSDFKAKKTDFLSWEDVADLMEKVYLDIEPDWRARHVEKISEIGQ